MANVLLVRHGQASFGSANYDQLSPLGEEQSQRLGRWLKQAGKVPDLVVVGSLRRHTQTADHCLAAAGIEAPRVAVAGLDEFDHEEVLARYRPDLATPDQLMAELARSDDTHRTFQAMFSAAVARWVSGEFDHEYTRSWSAFRASVLTGLDELVGQEARTIWAFTSGGPIAVIVNALVGAPAADTFSLSWPLANTSTSRISASPKSRSLISYNAWPHLEDVQVRHLVSYR